MVSGVTVAPTTPTAKRRPRQPATFVEARVDELADSDWALMLLLDLALDTEGGRALLVSARRRARR